MAKRRNKSYWGARKGMDRKTARRLGAGAAGGAAYLGAGLVTVSPLGVGAAAGLGAYGGYKAVQRHQRSERQRAASRRNLARARARRRRRG